MEERRILFIKIPDLHTNHHLDMMNEHMKVSVTFEDIRDVVNAALLHAELGRGGVQIQDTVL